MVEKIFKKCSCGMDWELRKDFIQDPEVAIVGYQSFLADPVKGMFLFNHITCKSTLGIKILEFKDLYSGPVYTDKKTGGVDCPGYCLEQSELRKCPAKCSCVYVREIMQLLKK